MKLKNGMLLLLTAAIWGVAFVAQSVGMEYVGPFTFNAVRSIIGGIVLLPVIILSGRKSQRTEISKDDKAQNQGRKVQNQDSKGQNQDRKVQNQDSKAQDRKNLVLGGVSCGVMLCLASNFQQFGVKYSTVGKAGFITACYIVLVPILSFCFGKKIRPAVWVAVVMALAGLYLLCMEGNRFSPVVGDVLLLVCALLFSFHILVIDYFSPKADGVKISCIQFFVCGLLSAAVMLWFEKPVLSDILAAWLPIGYAGVFSCGVAYTLQIIGQKGMNPTVASLILSLESSISVLAGWVILGQKLTGRQLAGCVVMFGAIILAQLPQRGTGR